MNGFEEQARSAATDAHESVTRLAVPELGGGAPSGGRRLVLAGAAVIALLVAGVFLLRGDDPSNLDVVAEPEQPATGDDADDGSANDGPGEAAALAYFVPAFDPEWEFFAREDGRPDAPDIRLSLFGAGTDDDWIADGFLVIAATEDQEAGGFGEDAIEVRGREGFITQDLTPGSNGIEWQETDGVGIQVASDVMSIDELIAFAEGFEIDGLLVTPTAPPPSDMVLLVDGFDQDRFLELTGGWAIAASSADETDFVSLTGARGSDDGLLITRIINAAEEPVELRSTTGYRSVDERFNAVVWLEDGMILTLYASPGTDVVALAEQVEPITSAEWQALLDGSINPEDGFGGDDTSDDPAFDVDLDSGTLDVNGELYDWRVRASNVDLCFFFSPPGGDEYGDCTRADRPDSPVISAAQANPYRPGYAMGVLGEGVETVVVTTETAEIEAMVYTISDPNNDLEIRLFATPLVKPDDVWFVTSYDENGDSMVQWGFESESYPTVQPPVSDYPTVLPTIPPPFEYPRIGPLEGGRIIAETLGTTEFWLFRESNGDLCAEVGSTAVDHIDVTCSPFDILFLTDGDGQTFTIGLAPECTTEVTAYDVEERATDATLFPGERGEVVFVTVLPEPSAGYVAIGEGSAAFSFENGPLNWNVEQVCTAQF